MGLRHVLLETKELCSLASGSSSTGSGSYGNKNGYVVRVLDQRLSNSLHDVSCDTQCLLKCPVIVIVLGVSTFSAPLLVELVHVGEILEDVGRVGDRMRAGGCVVERGCSGVAAQSLETARPATARRSAARRCCPTASSSVRSAGERKQRQSCALLCRFSAHAPRAAAPWGHGSGECVY